MTAANATYAPFPSLPHILLEAQFLDADLCAVARPPHALLADRGRVDPLALHDARRRLCEEDVERAALVGRDLERRLDARDAALEGGLVDCGGAERSSV